MSVKIGAFITVAPAPKPACPIIDLVKLLFCFNISTSVRILTNISFKLLFCVLSIFILLKVSSVISYDLSNKI